MTLIIDDGFDGLTVKNVLRSKLGLSASALTALKAKSSGITVDGQHVTVRHVLKKGERLELNIADETPSKKIKPVDLPIDVIFEDDYILAVNKPASLPVHPSKKLQDDTLAGRVLSYITPFVFRCVTRLDKDTTGAVIIAKDMLTAKKLTDLHYDRSIEKSYLAVVKGEGELAERGRIDLNIRRKPPSFVERETVKSDVSGSENDPCGVSAITDYEVYRAAPPYYLVKVFPITGRTHQIRVHFSGIGFPIVGDTLYGGTSELIGRQALHAAIVSFSHPETGERLSVCAPLQDDMNDLLKKLFPGCPDIRKMYEKTC